VTHGTTARSADSKPSGRESTTFRDRRRRTLVLTCAVAMLLAGILITAANVDGDSGHDVLSLLRSVGRDLLSLRSRNVVDSRPLGFESALRAVVPCVTGGGLSIGNFPRSGEWSGVRLGA
jgi:hypothetical protein